MAYLAINGGSFHGKLLVITGWYIISQYIWVNFITTSLFYTVLPNPGIMFSKGNHPHVRPNNSG